MKQKMKLPDIYLYTSPELINKAGREIKKVVVYKGSFEIFYQLAKDTEVWYMDTETFASPKYFNENALRTKWTELKLKAKDKLSDPDLRWIDNEIQKKRKVCALSPRHNQIRLIQIKLGNSVHILDLKYIGNDLGNLFKLMSTKDVCFQNAKFDLSTIYSKYDVLPKRVFDTMIADRIIKFATPNRDQPSNLGSILRRYLGINLNKELGSSDFSGKLSVDQIIYAYHDVAYLDHLVSIQVNELNDMVIEFDTEVEGVKGLINFIAVEEMEFVKTIARLELKGILISKDNLQKHITELKPRLDELKEYFKESGCNYNSTKQVKEFLKNEVGLDVDSTGKPTLSKHAEVFEVSQLLEIKKLSREYKTTVDLIGKYSEEGFLYPQFNTLVGATGRLSCSKPNVQNIPRELKNTIYKAQPGYEVWRYDYPAEEVRLAGFISNDQPIIKAFKKGKDVHTMFASICFGIDYTKVTKGQRQEAKSAVFGFLYGMGANTFQDYARRDFGIVYGLEEAKGMQKMFFQIFKGWKKYHRKIHTILSDDGSAILKTLYGRLAYMDRFTKAVNYRVQGTAADIIKIAMNRIQKFFDKEGMKSYMISTVHDEVLFQIHKEEWKKADKIIRKEMERSINSVIISFKTEIEGEKLD